MERGYTYYVPNQSRGLYSLLPFINEIDEIERQTRPLRYVYIVDEGLRSPIDMSLLRQGILLLLHRLCNEELVVSEDDVRAIIEASVTYGECAGITEKQGELLLSIANGILKVCKDAEDK